AQVQHVGPLPIRWFEGDADGDWDQRAEARRQQSDESPESRGRDEDPDVGFSAVGRGELVQNELHVRGVVLVRREAARDDFGFDVGNGHGVWPGGFRRRIVFLWWPRLRFGAHRTRRIFRRRRRYRREDLVAVPRLDFDGSRENFDGGNDLFDRY